MTAVRMTEVIRAKYPQAYNEVKVLINSAEPIDQNKIELINILCKEMKEEDWMYKLLFISSCLLLFSPETLQGKIKVRHKVGQAIASQLNVTHNAISQHIKNARHYYCNIQGFRYKVEKIVKEVRDE